MQARTALAAATAAAALVLPTAAQAHVTVNPGEIPAGSFQLLGVRVPNERDDSSTVKVELRLPPGVAFLSYEPQPSWRVRLVTRRAARPFELFGERVEEEVAKVVFRGSRRGLGAIKPGQFREFRLSTLLPGQAGDVLAFPALQTYGDGEVVRWTGGPDSELPAPRVTLITAAEAHGSAAGAPAARAAHTGIARRTPAPGASVAGPRTVSLKLEQGVLSGSIAVRRAGRRVTASASGLKPGDRTVLRATFARALAAGSYSVGWSVRRPTATARPAAGASACADRPAAAARRPCPAEEGDERGAGWRRRPQPLA